MGSSAMKPIVSVAVSAQNASVWAFGVRTPAAVARIPNTHAAVTSAMARS